MNTSQKILIGGSIIIAIGLVSTVIFATLIYEQIKQNTIENIQRTNAAYLSSIASNSLTIENFKPIMFEEKNQIFSNYFEGIKNEETVRIKVWSKNGTIIFSDGNVSVGDNFSTNPRFQTAIQGQVNTEIKEPIDPENISEMGFGQLMEIYVPIYLDYAEPVGVIELYFSMDKINESTDNVATLVYTVAFILIGLVTSATIVSSILVARSSKQDIQQEKFASIGAVTSRLAHDLRNPLSVINTGLDLIAKRTQEKQTIETCTMIQDSVKRLNHQVEDVLSFVKPRSLVIKETNLNTLITRAIAELSVPNRISIEKPSQNPTIFCDEQQCVTVLNNIIFNAIQKLDSDGTITISYDDDQKNHIIKIQDSGDAIPEKDLKKIFEPLYTTKLQGTGLGLNSCKTIIESHHGRIFASNHPTTFTILLPKMMK